MSPHSGDGSPSSWESFKLIQDSLLRIWAIFVQWFTWFFGAELLTLTWILAPTGGASDVNTNNKLILGVAFLWAFCSLVAVAATAAIGLITYRGTVSMSILAETFPRKTSAQIENILTPWPILYPAVGMALALLAALCVWISLIVKLGV
jgi:hypothetical protein